MTWKEDKDNGRLFEEIAYHLFIGELEDRTRIIKELARLRAEGRYNNPFFDEKREMEAVEELILELIDEAMAKGIFLNKDPKGDEDD